MGIKSGSDARVLGGGGGGIIKGRDFTDAVKTISLSLDNYNFLNLKHSINFISGVEIERIRAKPGRYSS